MKKELKADLNRIIDLEENNKSIFAISLLFTRYLVTSAQFRAIFFYRLANQNFFKDNNYRVIFSKIGPIFSGIFIPPTVNINGGLLLGHLKCIVIHYKCVIGENVTILQNVTLGGT